jgi:hypothetical protein
VFNGSHSVHGVSEDGVTVMSPDGGERLRIRPHDAPLLVRLGAPEGRDSDRSRIALSRSAAQPHSHSPRPHFPSLPPTQLQALGEPLPFPNPCYEADMAMGVSANLHNNVWGTNYAQWIPYSQDDATLVFRFTIEAEPVASPTPAAAATPAREPAAAEPLAETR